MDRHWVVVPPDDEVAVGAGLVDACGAVGSGNFCSRYMVPLIVAVPLPLVELPRVTEFTR